MISTELRKQAEAWRAGDPDSQTAAELEALLAKNDSDAAKDVADRFAMALEFGTAGLRGVLGAGPNRMNRAVVRRTTAGLARYLKEHVPDVMKRGVVVGRDGRKLSPEFAADTAAVLAAEGIPAHVFEDVVPTPVCAFGLLHLNAAAAVMVTASHNPPEYNGYKVYWGTGGQIIPPHDQGIAAAIDRVEPANEVKLMPLAEASERGLFRHVGAEVSRAYVDAILALRLHKTSEPKLRIVYTAMHGVGGKWVLQALSEAGFREVFPVAAQHEPDGRFPTVRFPNPEEPGAMDLSTALAEEKKADLVLANDPDADRLAAMVREKSGSLRMLTGNEIGVLLGHYLLTQGDTSGKRLVATSIVSSPQLGEIARAVGAEYGEVLTGFKWIAHEALSRPDERFVFGYEEALGYSVGEVVRDKDGVSAALVFADLTSWCQSRGQTVAGYLEEIQREHGLFLSGQRNFTFPGAEGLLTIQRIMEGFRTNPPQTIGPHRIVVTKDYQKRERVEGNARTALTQPASNVVAYELEGGSRITIRPSGTEPKIKYYLDLKETLGASETVEAARARGQERMTALGDAVVALAKDRGQP